MLFDPNFISEFTRFFFDLNKHIFPNLELLDIKFKARADNEGSGFFASYFNRYNS